MIYLRSSNHFDSHIYLNYKPCQENISFSTSSNSQVYKLRDNILWEKIELCHFLPKPEISYTNIIGFLFSSDFGKHLNGNHFLFCLQSRDLNSIDFRKYFSKFSLCFWLRIADKLRFKWHLFETEIPNGFFSGFCPILPKLQRIFPWKLEIRYNNNNSHHGHIGRRVTNAMLCEKCSWHINRWRDKLK